MGYRIILLEVSSSPDTELSSFLKQFISFTRFRGASVRSKKPKNFPGIWDITIEGNSSFLNELTAELDTMLPVIVKDINLHSTKIMRTAVDISSQLNDQIVDWSATSILLAARPGRELGQRIYGESSFVRLKDELQVHAARTSGQLAKYRNAKGPRAWRQRHELELPIRIDGLALLSTARRLRRIADDVKRRLPSHHLDAAVARFDQATSSLTHLRNIAEHLDEYSIGRGKIDSGAEEPAEVFSVEIESDDVSISARGRTLLVLRTHRACLSLISCLNASSDRSALAHLMPPFTDFDFAIFDGGRFVPVAREQETAEQSKQRESMNKHRAQMNFESSLPEERCPECNELL